MNVGFVGRGKPWSLLLVALTILVLLPKYSEQLIKCKQDILNNFYLTGIKHSIYEPMFICPHVHDRCCSLADEVKIKHLVEKHTVPILERRVTLILRSLGAIVDSFMELMSIDVSLMVLSYTTPREVHIKSKHCFSTPRVMPTKKEEAAYMAYHKGVTKYVRRRSLDAFLKIRKPYRRWRYTRVFSGIYWYWRYNYQNPHKWHTHQANQRRQYKFGFHTRQGHRTEHHPYHNSYSYHPFNVFDNYESSMPTECNTSEEIMYRDFIIVNQQKVKYCVGLHDAFLDMNLKLIIQYFSNVKMSLNKILSMKSTLYCSICDANKQRFFKEKAGEIIVSRTFCRNFLKTEKDYFTFMHVILIEFLNSILQYLACYETDARVFEFPYPSFMLRYTRRIKYVQKCLNSVDDKKNFYKNCYMICRQFSLTKFSTFFEGDMEMLKRVNVGLNSFLRKYHRGENLQNKANDKALKKFGLKDSKSKEIINEISIPENVDGVLLEPFGPHSGITGKHFYMSNADRVRMYNLENTEQFNLAINKANAKDVKKLKNLKKKLAKAKRKKAKNKLLAQIAKLKKKKVVSTMFKAPKQKKLKFPFKKMRYGASGLVDRLSTRLFSEHLKVGMYPQRGVHKLTKRDWLFRKNKPLYHTLKKKKKPRRKVKRRSRRRRLMERELSLKKKKKKNKKESKGCEDCKKKRKKKKTRKPKKPKKKKNPYDVTDQIKDKVEHKHYRDVISSPNEHGDRKFILKPQEDFPKTFNIEILSQIFEKSLARSKVMTFYHEFEDEGLDPLEDLDHVNFKYNTTNIIRKRFELPEELDRSVVSQYLSIPRETLVEFNDDMEDMEIDDFDTVDEKLRDVKDLMLIRNEMLKGDHKPIDIAQINVKIGKLEKAMLENEANRKKVIKAMKLLRARSGHSDLNHNKYPHYHHHHDMYYTDSFAGVTHLFESFFGT